jgi:hypothetical protein
MLESGELNVDIMMLDVRAKNEIHLEDATSCDAHNASNTFFAFHHRPLSTIAIGTSVTI